MRTNLILINQYLAIAPAGVPYIYLLWLDLTGASESKSLNLDDTEAEAYLFRSSDCDEEEISGFIVPKTY